VLCDCTGKGAGQGKRVTNLPWLDALQVQDDPRCRSGIGCTTSSSVSWLAMSGFVDEVDGLEGADVDGLLEDGSAMVDVLSYV
jgi:hypothetical protein